jgi:hypothetical protein
MLPVERDTLIDMETPGSVPADVQPDAPVAGESSTVTGPVWRFLIEPRWIGWHLFVVAAFWGMLWLGDWQFRRAMAGNGLSWAYTFEWPLFAGFGLVFWARTVRDEFRLRRGTDGGQADAAAATAESALPAGLGVRQVERAAGDADHPDDAEDAEVASYNAYLAKLNAEIKQTHGKWHGF